MLDPLFFVFFFILLLTLVFHLFNRGHTYQFLGAFITLHIAKPARLTRDRLGRGLAKRDLSASWLMVEINFIGGPGKLRWRRSGPWRFFLEHGPTFLLHVVYLLVLFLSHHHIVAGCNIISVISALRNGDRLRWRKGRHSVVIEKSRGTGALTGANDIIPALLGTLILPAGRGVELSRHSIHNIIAAGRPSWEIIHAVFALDCR